MKSNQLTEENIKFCCKDCLDRALELYRAHNFEDLEELLRVQWQEAQDKAIILQRMYSEVANSNLLAGLDNPL